MLKKLKHQAVNLLQSLSRIFARKTNKGSSLNNDELEDRKIRPDETIKRENVVGTPFTIVQTEKKTFIALGMYAVTGDLSYKECKQAILERDWHLMMNVARLIVIDEIKIDKEATKAEREQAKKIAEKGKQNYR